MAMRRIVAAIAGLTLFAAPALARPLNSIPQRFRAALGTCLQLGDGETHRFETRGTQLVNRYTATGRFGRQSFREAVLYFPDLDQVRFACGARTQHGQSCYAKLGADGALEVTVVHRGYRGVVASTSTIGATSCGPGG